MPPRTPVTRSTNPRTASSPPFSRVSVSTGMNAWANAPSANNRLKKLGILKATKNASALLVAPTRLASTTSRTSPRTLDTMVAPPTNALEWSSPLAGPAGLPSELSVSTCSAIAHEGPHHVALTIAKQ